MIYYIRKLSFVPSFAFRLTRQLWSMISLQYSTIRRIRKVLDSLIEFKGDRRLASYFLWLSSPRVSTLFKSQSDLNGKTYSPESILLDSLKNISREKDSLNKMLYWEQKYFLPDHNLNYTDKMGMAHGVEIRVPFLDKELVEFSTTIPPALKMKGTTTKYILKKVAERYLPPDVIYRPKTGFGAPVRDWIVQDLNPQIQQSFKANSDVNEELFRNEAVLRLVEENRAGKIDASYPIWALLAIKSWCKQFAPAHKSIDQPIGHT
jgi:asparagine synthase (glutamine-hydrolysing)